MNKKQKKILIDAAFVLFILFLAVTPIFNGKTGIKVLGGMVSKDVVDVVGKSQ